MNLYSRRHEVDAGHSHRNPIARAVRLAIGGRL